MARDNIFRNPKSAFLTFASLFLGLILFLVSAGLLSSLSPDNFVNQWGESDFALTYSISEEGNLLSDEMLQQIETMQELKICASLILLHRGPLWMSFTTKMYSGNILIPWMAYQVLIFKCGNTKKLYR